MLKSNFFRAKNFNIFYDFGFGFFFRKANPFTNLARKKSYLARKNFYL